MKRILFLVLLFVVSTVVKAQYPVTQFLGSDSAMVKSRGGLQGRFAPIPFTDTTSANLSRISQYPGALIYTSGVDKYWYRNATVTGWIEFTSSGGSTVNIYNSNGTLTGERTVDGDGNGLQFNSFRWFAVGADSVQIALNAGVFRVTGMTETQDTNTYKPIVVDPITGRVLQSSYWFGGSGGGGGTTGIRFDSSYTPLGGSRGVDSFVVKSIRIRRNNVTVVPTEFGDSAAFWNIDVPDTTSLSNRINEKLDKIGSADSVSITVINPVFRLIGLDAGIGGEDVLVIDPDTYNVKTLPISTIQTDLQGVLNIGSTLSGTNDISATDPDNDWLFFGAANPFDLILFKTKRRLNISSDDGSGNYSVISAMPDSIVLYPGNGTLRIESLNSGSSTDSVLVWDESTGLVKKRNASAFSGGGGGSGTVTSIGTGYGLSGGTITTTGTILVDSASLSNYYLRRKDSLTASNLLGYVTRTILADSAAAIRSAIGSSSGWALTGNSTTGGWTEGDFLGTTNNRSILIRTNNILRARIDSAGAAGVFRLYPATRTDAYLDFGTTANTWNLFGSGVNLTATSAVSVTSNSVATAAFYNGGVTVGSGSGATGTRLQIDNQSSTLSAIKLSGTTLKTTPVAGDIDRDHSYLYVTLGSATRQKIATDIDTLTLTNKRITPRVGTTASSSSLTIASDSYDRYTVTALAADMTINNPSGTPTDGQTLLIRIKDNGTARALTWSGSQFRVIGVTLPTTTVISKTVYIGLIWNSADSKWDVVSVNQEV